MRLPPATTLISATFPAGTPTEGFFKAANFAVSVKYDPHRDIPRTWDRLIDKLIMLNKSGQLPDFSSRNVAIEPAFVPPKPKYSQRFLNRVKKRFAAPIAEIIRLSETTGSTSGDRSTMDDTPKEIVVKE